MVKVGMRRYVVDSWPVPILVVFREVRGVERWVESQVGVASATVVSGAGCG